MYNILDTDNKTKEICIDFTKAIVNVDLKVILNILPSFDINKV